jgi:hypothetical protein
MRLCVVPELALNRIMQQIANAAHESTDTAGAKMDHGTIDPERLRIAARLAVEMATGEVVWPENERLRITQPKPAKSVVEVA